MPESQTDVRRDEASSAAPAAARGRYAKSEDTRRRILDAALRVASEHGFHRASVIRIAECAGVAVGNLHYHFGSREGLLLELMESLATQLLERVAAEVPPDVGYLDGEEAVFRAYLAWVHDNPAYVRLAEEARLHHPELYQRHMSMWLAIHRDRLSQGIARGELRRMDDDEIAVVAHLILGSRYFLDQLIEGVDGREYPGDEVVVRAHMNLVRGGLTAASGRS